MNRTLLLAILTLTLSACNEVQRAQSDHSARSLAQLESEFLQPPRSARPYLWWHWMNGNITKDGIRKDLLWMDSIGIGGFHHFDAGIGVAPIVENRLIYMHDDWKDAFRYAIGLGDSLGMEMTVASSPGWSCMGGPWVEPQDAMKKLVWREMRLPGGRPFRGPLPEPFSNAGDFQNLDNGQEKFYQDIAVLALRMPGEDVPLADMDARLTSSGGVFSVAHLTDDDLTDGELLPEDPEAGFAWIMYEFPEARSFRAVSLYDGRWRPWPYNSAPSYSVSLEKSDDGQNFTEVSKIASTSCIRTTISFPEARARFFRLRVNNTGGQGSKISEFRLYPVGRINHAEEKACFASPHDLHDYPTQTDGSFADQVIDLTDSVQGGVLSWNVPEGNWKVLRMGYSLTGHRNGPAPEEATGLEVDKLDPDALTRYYHTYLDMYRQATGGLLGKRGIQYLLTDSYEAGCQNWTPRMAEAFRQRRGYDLTPWLPVLTGEIVGSVEQSEAFLWDWNVTIAELYAQSYNHIDDILQEYGIRGRYSESHECGRAYVADGMDIKQHAAVPMAACWIDAGSPTMAATDIRESASVAHIYGQNLVAAESLTAHGTDVSAYRYSPGSLKGTADWEMANGLNRFVIHESAHQPLDSVFPGLGLGPYGQWFNRHETWASEARTWMDYLARSCYMLQQGRAVADILVYYGEDSNACAIYGFDMPGVPPGFNYDYANPQVVTGLLKVKDGKIRAGEMEYKVLYLGRNVQRMSVPVLRALVQLAQKGAPICGHTPGGPASLTDDAGEWQSLLAELKACPNVHLEVPIGDVAQVCSLEPDVQYPQGEDIRFVHRRSECADIYWINKPSDAYQSLRVSFRQTGRRPRVWHPETGRTEDAAYTMRDGRTEVTLSLVPDDAVFVVFGEKTDLAEFSVPDTASRQLCQVDGPWQVTFQPRRGAPAGATFPSLVSYTDSSDPGIRYFSGRAVYTNTFSVGELPEGRIVIDLGDVRELARVRLNGQDCGLVWKKPFRADITDAIRQGENQLEITVINTWVNRLIGDQQPDCPRRITYTSYPFYKQYSQLRSAGLLGPVFIDSIVLRPKGVVESRAQTP